MNKIEFLHLVKDQMLYLDGATGSNLVKAGMPSGVCPEQWILENPQALIDLQRQYIEAGSNIIYAPTFTANRIKLDEYGLADRIEEINTRLVQLSKEAIAAASVDRSVYIAGDITMTGQILKPMGPMDMETLIEVYREQVTYLAKAGVDCIVIETMMSLGETRAAIIAAKEVCDLPILVTFTFERDGRTLYGTDARTAAVVCDSLGAAAIGVNCSTGPKDMQQLIIDMTEVTNLPIIAKPNAGLPFLDSNGCTAYTMDATTFVQEMGILVEAGARFLGGCCGTTPEFIKGLHETYGNQRAWPNRKPAGIRYLTSERKTVSFSLDDPFMIVGERINPTGKKALQAQLREGSMELVLQFAEEQERCGAEILDVNMGMSGINEKELMLQALEEVTQASNLPLSLDSSYVEVLEAALLHYPGRALINSISMETEKLEKLLPIAKKYGAMFILLPLSDKGLPENLEEKKQIIHTIYDKAQELGLCREDIIVDGLVTTIGANKTAALETLETIRYCKENGFATICGLSNISFGMPERSYVNTAFLNLAIQNGLTMAIANPSQEMLVLCAMATDLLLNKPESDLRYIEYANQAAEKKKNQVVITQPASPAGNNTPAQKPAQPQASGVSFSNPSLEQLYQGVLKGNRGGIVKLTEECLSNSFEAEYILNTVLLPAINDVGELFDKGKYFLPQLIASAEAMKLSVERLEPLLATGSTNENMPVVVIATVEGDIHDIGKNLVALMLKNYGFKVIDLGKDVPMETIIEAAIEHQASIIALSALMTTTMQEMRKVVDEVKRRGLDIKIMIGGAVITQEYADEIGADGYSKDAQEAVKLAQRLNSIHF